MVGRFAVEHESPGRGAGVRIGAPRVLLERRRRRRRRRAVRGPVPHSHDQAVGGDAEVQRAARRPVHVDDVVDHAHAKAVDVEVRVARLERIEGPELAGDAAAGERGALVLLEAPADAVLARLGADAEHVRPVDELVVADAGEAEDESEEGVVGEGAEEHAADVGGDFEHRRGDDVAEFGAPDGGLEGDARLKLVERDEGAERDAVRVGLVERCYRRAAAAERSCA